MLLSKNRLMFVGLIIFVFLTLPIATFAEGKVVGGQLSVHPEWFKESFLDIAEDVDEAAENNKHVILFMHLAGCPYCHKMTEENFKHAPYTDFIKENFDVIAINIKGDREIAFNETVQVSEKDLAKKLKVNYTPTIIFLDENNKVVARTNGYRSVPAFKQVLEYVNDRAYKKMTLATYIEQKKRPVRYSFKSHPQFQEISNLHDIPDKPLAVIFEDIYCDACDDLYEGHLSNPDINKVLENFTVVRLDALSNKKITSPSGQSTTPKAFAKHLNLIYRPGIVLFDKGKEIMRIDNMLYTHHFTEILRFVGERHYPDYPNGFRQYSRKRTAEILSSGKNIDLSK